MEKKTQGLRDKMMGGPDRGGASSSPDSRQKAWCSGANPPLPLPSLDKNVLEKLRESGFFSIKMFYNYAKR